MKEFYVLIDNETELKLLEQNPLTDKLWSVFIEVDCGYGRGPLYSFVIMFYLMSSDIMTLVKNRSGLWHRHHAQCLRPTTSSGSVKDGCQLF